VGYPGETDAEFAETLAFLKTIRFNSLFAFKYSPRPGTVSAEELDSVPETLKETRLQQVLDLSKEITREKALWN
jgi:tRNA-2-methylthio-N6-dimethylallyladenosine synthase